MIRKLLFPFAASAFILAACGSSAQTSSPTPTAPATPAKPPVAMVDADPALWVVKDADTTIYLFGTVHVLKPGLSWFDEAVKAAFDKSDTLVLEIVQPDAAAMQGLVMSKAFDPAGPSLGDRLPAADKPLYLKALADYGLPAPLFDHARPWFAATTLSILPLMKLGYDPAQGPESVLAAAAAAAHKPVEGLETAEQQIGYLSGLSDPTQLTFLETTLHDLSKVEPMMNRMVDAWSHGDPATLGKLLNDGIDDSPELAKTLLFDRNGRWATWIKARMAKPGTVFIAVGAGHLAGDKSVIEQLKPLGITAQRVAY